MELGVSQLEEASEFVPDLPHRHGCYPLGLELLLNYLGTQHMILGIH